MRAQPDTAMVFAAGKGTRMRPLTDRLPKPLVQVAGRALLDHTLDLVAGAGLARAVVNSHYLGDQIAAHLARGWAGPGLAVAHAPDGADGLETGGGMRAARGVLGEAPVFTLNSDAIWSGPNPITHLATQAGAWRAGGACLLLVPRARALGHRGAGDFNLGPGGDLIRRAPAPMADYVYTGVQWIDPAVVYGQPGIGALSLNPVWDMFAAQGRLSGVVYPGDWCDVGQPESLPLAREVLARPGGPHG